MIKSLLIVWYGVSTCRVLIFSPTITKGKIAICIKIKNNRLFFSHVLSYHKDLMAHYKIGVLNFVHTLHRRET